ncbi:MAG: replication initiation factor domain-containing protein [Anaerolineae bacterium]|nr:replication initiation factor domain-containing protein [Anaerolineae bacterium]
MENKKEITFKIDWMAITIWGTDDYAQYFWQDFLLEYLGDVISKGHGGRGFREIGVALASAKLYTSPVNDGLANYFHIELPGSACAAIPPIVMSEMVRELQLREEIEGLKYKVTRLDLAWDGISCTPDEFLEAVEKDYIRSLAKRETLDVRRSPFKEKEDGSSMGTTTVYLGSRTSTRSVRVYDKRGYTRLELETRKERADLIARIVLVGLPEDWADMAIGHLRDYMDVFKDDEKEEMAEWWEELVTGLVRAYLTVSSAADVELVRIERWMVKQVAPALSVLMDTVGEGVLDTMIAWGRHKRGDRYKHILNNIKPAPDFEYQQGRMI